MCARLLTLILTLVVCLTAGCFRQVRTGFYHAVKVSGPDTASLPVIGWTERAIVKKTPIVSVGDFEAVSACGDIENPCIALQLNPEGAEKFRLATAGSVGEYLAFVVEGRLVTAPAVVKSESSSSYIVVGCRGMKDGEVSAIVRKMQNLISKKAAQP